MRIVVDAMAASYGGISNYVRGMLRAWGEVAPQDELTVFLTDPYGAEMAADPRISRHRLVVLPERQPRRAWRLAWAETVLPRQQSQADALFATLPPIPILWRKPAVAVVHDLNHELHPRDFPISQKLSRRLFYTVGYRRADLLLPNSNRTADVLRIRHPTTAGRVAVVPHAADHVPLRASTRTGDAVGFGHSVNKNPELLLSTWAELWREGRRDLPRLHIIGLSELDRGRLRSDAARLGISNLVVLDAYLDLAELDTLMANASAVLFPSRYEGFGLPVLEAMRQGIPVVISPDAALTEVAGGHAAGSSSWRPADVAAAVERALAMTESDLNAARRYAEQFTWGRTVQLTRAHIQSVLR